MSYIYYVFCLLLCEISTTSSNLLWMSTDLFLLLIAKKLPSLSLEECVSEGMTCLSVNVYNAVRVNLYDNRYQNLMYSNCASEQRPTTDPNNWRLGSPYILGSPRL